MSDLARRIAEARSGVNPIENIRRMKHAVMDEIRAADPEVRIHVTDYFNHTYTPDFVLDWPQEDHSRYFYLRTNADTKRLSEDIETLAGQRPVLFALAAVPDKSRPEVVRLSAVATEADTLVTDAPALTDLAQANSVSPVAGLASSALLQGGRGVAHDDSVQRLVRVFVSGFHAARTARAAGTIEARNAIQASLDERSSHRLTQFLHAVWIGSGGATSAFPGGAYATSDLADDAIGHLLDLQELDEPAFWRRIGRRLTVDRLARLGARRPGTNFHHLIQASLDILTARVCKVLLTQDGLFDNWPEPKWTVDRGLLSLRGPRFSAYVSSKIDGINIRGDRQPGITRAQLVQRSDRLGRKVEQIGFESSDYRLSYESLRTDIRRDRTLQQISAAITGARVSTASVLLPDSRVLRCDFEALTATGRGSVAFPVADLVETSLGMFADFDEAELRELRELFDERQPPEGQQTLF